MAPLFLVLVTAYPHWIACDERLADRVRDVLEEEEGVTERKMFGGLAFMVRGHMACGIVGDDLMLRLGAEGPSTRSGALT